jgi:nitrogen fixation protein FixH
MDVSKKLTIYMGVIIIINIILMYVFETSWQFKVASYIYMGVIDSSMLLYVGLKKK